MNDHEYILSEVNKFINHNLEIIENRMVTGNLSGMEDYKFHLGARDTLVKLDEYIKILRREDV